MAKCCENHQLAAEHLVTLNQARNAFPVRLSLSTLQRYIRKGVRGIQLETVFIGGKRLTSQEAIKRFIERTQNVQGMEFESVVQSKKTEREVFNGLQRHGIA